MDPSGVCIFCLNVYVVEEALAQLPYGTVLAVGTKREIFIGIEHHHILEAKAILLMTANELLEDGIERETCTEGEHAFSACVLCTLYFSLNAVGKNTCCFLYLGIDVGEDFLTTGYFRTLYCRTWTVVLLRNLVQYDL